MHVITLIDYIAIAWFVSCWVGYANFAAWKSKRIPSLLEVVHTFRRGWMARMVERENRIVDSSILSNLSNSATFFASTTVFILGGLLALLGTTEKVVGVVAELPFTIQSSARVWEIKILLLIAIFIYAFFKFTWSLRQFNFCAILVGAAPKGIAEQFEDFVNRAARLASFAGDSFNDGLRAYYFGLAALSWFLHPLLLFPTCAWVVGVLYWREFHSSALHILVK